MRSRPNASPRFRRLLVPMILSALLPSACCPVVTGFAPGSGAEGTEVTIRGKRFESAAPHNRVKFGGITVPNALITQASPDTLKAIVPGDARSGPISVATRLCSSASEDSFTVVGAGSRPDLVPKAVYFDANRVLHVRIANEGAGTVPPGVGAISIFVDGRLLSQTRLSDIADQSFRSPGGSVDFDTNLRIGGSHRRVMVMVDARDEIIESNEMQNSLGRTLTPPPVAGPDLVVRDLLLGAGNILRILVQNIGTAATPPDLPVRLLVFRNGSEVLNVTQTVPALAPGAPLFIPVAAVVVGTPARIEAVVMPLDSSADSDITNNHRAKFLPDGPSLQPYHSLLADPNIRRNMIWHGRDANGLIFEKNYDEWSPAQKADLDQAILLLEREGRHALTLPPALISNANISAQDAWKIYLAHAAQSLWVEVHGMVSWRLADFGDDALKCLLDSRTLLVNYPTTPASYGFASILMGNITAWNPRISYQFLSNLNLVRPTQTATIFAVTDWMRAHLIHISADTDFNDQYGYAGPPPADRVLYPLEGKRHLTAGCWGTTGLYAALLRSVNIPVQSLLIELIGGSHSHPAFPSVALALVHGDDPYTMQFDMSGALVPTTRLFYPLAELQARFVNPPLDCVGSRCNTVGVQASYNQEKDQWKLACDYLADYPLYIYARNGAAGFAARLTGPDPVLAGYEYVKPLFSPDERRAMVDNVGEKLKEIGDGDPGAGEEFVKGRWQRFQDNK